MYNTFPDCDVLLQDALSRRVDSGEAVDVAGVLEAVEEAREQGGPGCAEDIYPWGGWVPSPVDGPSGGCPGSPSTGLQPDEALIVNWSERHRDALSRDYRDSYGWSSCWVREPDGEWGAYLRAGGCPVRPCCTRFPGCCVNAHSSGRHPGTPYSIGRRPGRPRRLLSRYRR